MNLSEYTFEYLNSKGTDTVFMVSGGQVMWLDDALGRNKKYNVICSHHEQACSMAADAYGRITNKPAIVLVTAGPGAINAVNGVVGGFTDSSPMIIISGHTNLNFVNYQENKKVRQFGIQGVNIGPMVKDYVKYFVTVKDPLKIKYYLEEAYKIATSGRPGPVWLEIPLDVQNAEIDQLNLIDYIPVQDLKNTTDIQTSSEFVLEKLNQAKRPIILAGQGVSLSNSREEFIKLVEKLNIPVLTSRLGIDLMESDNTLFVGRPGNYGERAANFAVQNADFILVLGCRLATALIGHNAKEFGKNAYKVAVDIDKEELNKPGASIDFKINCNCFDFIVNLNKISDYKRTSNHDEWNNRCLKWKTKYPVYQNEYSKANPINSYEFVNTLSNLCPENVAVTVDTGSCFHVASQIWKIKKGQRFLTTGGISSMGYWVAAVGTSMAMNNESTVVITGDGSFQMNLQELAVIKHNNLPIKIFILNNNGYLLIRHTQRNFMDDNFIGEGPNSGVWCPKSVDIANAYGIKGISIKNPTEISEKIKEVFEFDGPVICEVFTDEWQLLIPRISSEKMPDGTLKSRDYSDMFPFLPDEEYKKNMDCHDDSE